MILLFHIKVDHMLLLSVTDGHTAKIKWSIHLLNAADDALSVYVARYDW